MDRLLRPQSEKIDTQVTLSARGRRAVSHATSIAPRSPKKSESVAIPKARASGAVRVHTNEHTNEHTTREPSTDLLVRFGFASFFGKMLARVLTLLLFMQPVYVAMGMELPDENSGTDEAVVDPDEGSTGEQTEAEEDMVDEESTTESDSSSEKSEEVTETATDEKKESNPDGGTEEEAASTEEPEMESETGDTYEAEGDSGSGSSTDEGEQGAGSEGIENSGESDATEEQGAADDGSVEEGVVGGAEEEEASSDTATNEDMSSDVDDTLSGTEDTASATEESAANDEVDDSEPTDSSDTDESDTTSGGSGGGSGSTTEENEDDESTDSATTTASSSDEQVDDQATTTPPTATTTSGTTNGLFGGEEGDTEDDTPSTATTTDEVEVNIAQNPQSKFVFGESECTIVTSGEFYCVSATEKKGTVPGEARVYTRTDLDGDKEIFYHNGIEEKRVTNNDYDDMAPVLEEDEQRIVWHGMRSDRLQIFLYDIRSGTTEQITNNNVNSSNPHMHGDTLIWQEWGENNWDIVMVEDVDEGFEVERVTENGVHDMFPQVYEDLVTWQRERGADFEVVVMDRTTGKETVLEKHGDGRYENPRFALLFDARQDNGDTQTVGFDINTGEIVQLGSKPYERPVDSPVTPDEELPDAIPSSSTTTPKIEERSVDDVSA